MHTFNHATGMFFSLLPWIALYILLGITVLVVIAYTVSFLLRLLGIRRILRQEYVCLEITPPADSGESPLANEQLMAVLHGLEETRPILDKLLQRDVVFSAELPATRMDGIRYVLRVPERYAPTFQKHLFAHAPAVRIREVEDYLPARDILQRRARVLNFTLSGHFAYPLKRRESVSEPDPYAYLFEALSKLCTKELVSIQLVITPTKIRHAHLLGTKLLHSETHTNTLGMQHVPAAPGDYEAAALEPGDFEDLQPDLKSRDNSALADRSDVQEGAVDVPDIAARETDALDKAGTAGVSDLEMRPQIPVHGSADYENSPAEGAAAHADTTEGADETARVSGEDAHRVGELAMHAVGAAHEDMEITASDSGGERTSEPKSSESLGIFIDPPTPIPEDWSLEKEEARLREKYGYMPDDRNADSDSLSPEATAEARHGFMSVFANIIEERDPAAAATVRLSRDTAGSNMQQVSKASGHDTRAEDVVDGDGHDAAVSPTPRYDSMASIERPGSAAAQRGAKAGGADTMYCGKMSDIVGVEDPHGLVGGFFHDIALLFPWGNMLETDFDRACKAWFDSHPGELY